MSRARSLRFMLGACVPLCLAATLPETYNLREAVEAVNPIDPGLAKWYQDFTEGVGLLDRDAAAAKIFLSRLPPAAAALGTLRYNAVHKGFDKDAQGKLVAAVVADSEHLSHEPLISYVIDDLIGHHLTNKADAEKLNNALRLVKDQSCPQRGLLMRDLDEYKKSREVSEEKELIARIASFRAAKFQEDALEAMLGVIPENHKAALHEDLAPLVRRFPRLLEDNAWLASQDAVPGVSERSRGEPFGSFERVGPEVKLGRCNTARTFFLQGLGRDAKKQGLIEAEATAKRLESCHRPKGNAARLRFWAGIEEPLRRAYGFAGIEIALRSRGMALWGEDRFDETRAMFTDILRQARKNSLPGIEARTLYTLARIDENEGKTDAAIANYVSFISAFPEHEHYEAAIMSLVLLNVLKTDLKAALLAVDKLIEVRTLRPVDDQNGSSLAFALFWGGRIHLQLGHKDMAQEMWRRVASEFYSTFYGAIGHYMLEKLTDRPLVLEPTRSRPFVEDEIYADFDPQGRATIERIKGLLTLGLTEEAHCEIAELGGTVDDHGKSLVKAMYLYAAGDWLEAIKRFGSLPRPFRNTLPVGMERILFPKSYTDEVLRYSDKVGIDPDYILSIIRQESVFNPRARSPVGASGLMQLMPQTAKLEAASLRKDYLSVEGKKAMTREALNKGRLFDADVNLALGVHHVHRLMQRYRNPVLVLAAYNANPRAADRWLTKLSGADPLLFIENIPYKETRAYVKLVLRNYFYYKRWYGSPRDKMPHLDALATNIGFGKEDSDPFRPSVNYLR